MQQKKAYIILGSMAVVPISMFGYSSSLPQHPILDRQGGMIEVKSVGHPRDIVSRPPPMNPRYTAPADIKPIELNGVKYEELWYPPGTIRATDITTGEVIWQKQIYTIKVKNASTTNTLPILFSEFDEEVGKDKEVHLKVTNELGEIYAVDPKTGDLEIVAIEHYAQKQ